MILQIFFFSNLVSKFLNFIMRLSFFSVLVEMLNKKRIKYKFGMFTRVGCLMLSSLWVGFDFIFYFGCWDLVDIDRVYNFYVHS